MADDEGRFRCSPRYLRAKVFPYDNNISDSDIQEWVDELHSNKLIVKYDIDGKSYGYHPNWEKWQTIRKDRFKPSDCPNPMERPPSVAKLAPSGKPFGAEPNQTKPNLIKRSAKSAHPSKTKPAMAKSPYKADLTGIKCSNLSEGAKHKLFNLVIQIFLVRGWPAEGELPVRVFEKVSKSVTLSKPRNIFPYFQVALKSYVNKESDFLNAQAKIIRKKEKTKISSMSDILLGPDG